MEIEMSELAALAIFIFVILYLNALFVISKFDDILIFIINHNNNYNNNI